MISKGFPRVVAKKPEGFGINYLYHRRETLWNATVCMYFFHPLETQGIQDLQQCKKQRKKSRGLEIKRERGLGRADLSLWELQSDYCVFPFLSFPWVHPASMETRFNVLILFPGSKLSQTRSLYRVGEMGAGWRHSPSGWLSIFILWSCCVLVYFLFLHTGILPQHREVQKSLSLSSC